MKYWTADIETSLDEKTGSALTGRECFITWCDDERNTFASSEMSLTSFFTDIFLVEDNFYKSIYLHNGMRFDLARIDFKALSNYIDSKNWVAQFISDVEENHKAIVIYDREELKNFNEKKEAKKTNKYVKINKLEPLFKICDSFLITAMSLENLTKKFSPQFQKQKRKFTFDEKPFDVNDEEDVKYAIQDSLSLHHALEKFDELMQENFEVSIFDGYTASGLAMKVFKKKELNNMKEGSLIKENYKTNKYFESARGICESSRISYSGGMTLAFDCNIHENITGIDCNSMYPYVMLNYNLPSGKVTLLRNFKYENIEQNDLVLCTLDIPSNVFPIIKSENVDGVKGNWCGEVVCICWGFELQTQLLLGAKVKGLHRLWRWNNETNCVKQTIQKFKDLRFKDYNGPLGAMAKLLGNSLYGKFAQRDSDRSYFLTNKPMEDMIVSDNDGVFIKYQEQEKNLDLTHWASFICARARVHLFKSIYELGIDNVVYCDTDSIYFKSECIEKVKDVLGDEYGLFKIERELEIFKAYAPKAYYYKEKGKNEIKGKNKGIPQSKLIKELIDKKNFESIIKVDYVGLKSLKVIINSGTKELGYKTSRNVATDESITNGYFNELGKWTAHNSRINEEIIQKEEIEVENKTENIHLNNLGEWIEEKRRNK